MCERILVVDDDPTSLEITSTILTMAGCEVATATNGKEARRALDRGGFDALVTDLYMPEMDGLELIDSVVCQTKPIPVIAMSGGGSHDCNLLTEATYMGAREGLMKPFGAIDLLGALTRIRLDEGRRRRAAISEACPLPV